MARPSVKILDNDTGWGAFFRDLETEVYGKAGVIGEKAVAEHPGQDGAPLTNAELALIQEFGLGVPERSFIRAAFDAHREEYLDMLQRLVRAVDGKKMTKDRALALLAQKAASDQRNLIREGAGIPPPNAPSTIERKGSSRPLIDSGQMINAITGAVEHGEPEK